jgi:hypothetical protein
MPGLETAVQKRLNIKYVDAKQLVQEAKENLELPASPLSPEQEDAVIQEACEIFEDMEPGEQDAMRVHQKDSSVEPEWQRKAKAAAAKREQQMQPLPTNDGEERGRRMAQQAQADPVLDDDDDNNNTTTVIVQEVDTPGSTTTTTVTKKVTKTSKTSVSKAPLEMDGKVVCCTIL